jgi:hypothetical protein
MSYQLIKKVSQFKFGRVGLAAFFLTAAVGALSVFMPLQAYATTPPNGSLEVGSATSGVCARANGFTSGSIVVTAGCNNQINQKWYVNRAGYDSNGNIAYTFETAKAGSFQCLNDINKSTAHAAPVNLANCNGVNPAERFVYVNSSNGGNELRNIASGGCLDATTLGAQLVLDPCDANASSQLWFLTPNTAQP